MNSELKKSNELNARHLGGRTKSPAEEEDESNQLDVNMEKIMSRFNTFNSLCSQSSEADDDDDEEDEEKEEPDGEDILEDITDKLAADLVQDGEGSPTAK